MIEMGNTRYTQENTRCIATKGAMTGPLIMPITLQAPKRKKLKGAVPSEADIVTPIIRASDNGITRAKRFAIWVLVKIIAVSAV